MPSIKIKDHLGGPDRRTQLMAELGHRELEVWKVEEGGGHLYIVTGEEQIDAFFEDDIINSLQNDGYEILTTTEIKSCRTIIIRQVESSYKNKGIEEILRDVNQQNGWANAVEASFLPSQSKYAMLKITFSTINMASRAVHGGLKIIDQTLPPLYIEREVQVNPSPCTRCFGYDHLRRNCSNLEYNDCTRCGVGGHNFRHCSNANKKCASCGGNGHETQARECPLRKRYLQEKGKAEKNKERNKAMERQKFYVEKRKEYKEKPQNQETTNVFSNCDPVPANSIAVILTAITTASLIDRRLPGTFQSTFEDVCHCNKMPKVQLPQSIIEKLNFVLQEETPSPDNLNNPEAMSTSQGPFEDPTEAPPKKQLNKDISKSSYFEKTEMYSNQRLDEQRAVNWSMPELTDEMLIEPSPLRPLDVRPKEKRPRPETEDPDPTNLGQTYTKYKEEENPKKQMKQNEPKDKPHDPAALMQTIKELSITVYYPIGWTDNQGRIDKHKALGTLIKSKKLNLTYDSDRMQPEHKTSPKTMLKICHREKYSLDDVDFQGLQNDTYNKLLAGDWSFLEISSSEQDEEGEEDN